MLVILPILTTCILLLSGCTTSHSVLLHKIRPLKADGTLGPPLAEKELSPFQQLLRAQFPKGRQDEGSQLFAMELDVPDGTGTEGAYVALLRATSGATELRYYEQSEHRPRVDRYFHRMLTSDEATALAAFLQMHPLADIRVFRVAPIVPPEVASTQPESATEPDTPATEPQDAGPPTIPLPSTQPAEAALIALRLTVVQGLSGQTLQLPMPGDNDHPAVDLIRLLAKFRNAGTYACTYTQTIPLTASPLFADPFRKVIWVSCIQGDLRIGVTAPTPPMQDPDVNELHWLAFRGGKWVESYRPGNEPQTQPATAPATDPAEAGTEPATEPATQIATEPVAEPATQPATQPGPDLAGGLPMDPRLLPIGESWWTRPGSRSTVVYHYVPLGPTYGVTHGFVVPGFEFDDDHAAVDNRKGELYLIHDGVLFSLVIPENAR